MCNDYRLEAEAAAIGEAFDEHGIRIRFPEGVPNLEPRADIRITDPGAIVRGLGARGEGELVQRRWSWPGPGGKPVFNFRADGREFATGRCLIVADGFYEFTAPAEPEKKTKDKWLLTLAGARLFCIAGIWRAAPQLGEGPAGEAFTMLTLPPGPDVAPYHDRQIAVLDPARWADWLDPSVPAQAVLATLPAGSLAVARVG